MEATEEQLEALAQLEKLDVQIATLEFEFKKLPQRSIIIEARKKIADLEEKQASVNDLQKKMQDKFDALSEEDSAIVERAAKVQEAIDACKDFRAAEAHTKELAGLMRRQKDLEPRIEEATAQLAKIADAQGKLESAFAAVRAQEAAATEEFKVVGGDLKAKISLAEKRHQELLQVVGSTLEGVYAKAAKKAGGIGVSSLSGEKCSVCRTPLTDVQLLKVKHEAPVSTCPNCSRLLVVSGASI